MDTKTVMNMEQLKSLYDTDDPNADVTISSPQIDRSKVRKEKRKSGGCKLIRSDFLLCRKTLRNSLFLNALTFRSIYPPSLFYSVDPERLPEVK